MTDEERAALWREQRVECRAALVASERRLAGSTAAREALTVDWNPVYLAHLEAQMPPQEDCSVEPVTAQNRDCIC